MKKIIILLVMILLAFSLVACKKDNQDELGTDIGNSTKSTQEDTGKEIKDQEIEVKKESYTVNIDGVTIEERYPTSKDYNRVKVEGKSFGEFLRSQKLKAYGEKVIYYNGREKDNNGIYDSVFDVDIGDRDLHQCADAIMLLRAEYLYSNGLYDRISFNFVSGFTAEYKKWMEGYRIRVEGNDVSYYKATDSSNSYESFRKYMDMVMAYASTLSLEKELQSVDIDDMQIGDIFIVGGSPGHAIIVVDMATNHEGKSIFLLAQSYMPAQQTQILINPMDREISPWYSLEDKEKLITPEWSFELADLKRFS